MTIEKAAVKAFVAMMKALSNETRFNIVYSLYQKPKNWTELLFGLRVNPKSLRDHLRYLQEKGMVRKSNSVGFELTEAAKTFIKLSFKDVVRTAKLAAKIAQAN